jgi:hypothetical protein
MSSSSEKENSTTPETDSRVRQFHTRSRTGCSNCRTRRKRCDEQRPQWYGDPESLAPTVSWDPLLIWGHHSYNCVRGQRTCVYAPPKIPLRERRAQQKEARPWDQMPWELEQTPKEIACLKKTNVPPRLSCLNYDTGFNKLAVAMPLKSHELFQYCQLP